MARQVIQGGITATPVKDAGDTLALLIHGGVVVRQRGYYDDFYELDPLLDPEAVPPDPEAIPEGEERDWPYVQGGYVLPRVRVGGLVKASRIVSRREAALEVVFFPFGAMPATVAGQPTEGGITNGGTGTFFGSALVREALSSLQAILQRTEEMDAALRGLLRDPTVSGATALEDIRKAVSEIGATAEGLGWNGAPVVDYNDIPRLLNDANIVRATGKTREVLEQMDPAVVLVYVKTAASRRIAAVENRYREALKASPSWPVVRRALLYLEDLKRIGLSQPVLDAAQSASDWVNGVSVAEFAAGPYAEFTDLVSSEVFTLDGLVPNGYLSAEVEALVRELQKAEEALDRLRRQITLRQ